MKKLYILLWAVISTICVNAETLTNTYYFDMGSQTSGQGTLTDGADANGNYWNNIYNNVSGNKYLVAGTVYSNLINSSNTSSTYSLTINTRFSSNGQSGGGGLLAPSAANLGDLAVASATEDYIFLESSEDNSYITLAGLDPNKGYKFYCFGSRIQAEVRTAYYTFDGINSFTGECQTSGTDCGGTGVNQNVANICTSTLVYPNDLGEIKFTISRKTGAYIALNCFKMEEYTGGTRPIAEPVVTSLALSGSASETGSDIPMHLVSATGSDTQVFELFTQLQPGTYSFSGITNENDMVTFGMGASSGVLAENGTALTVAEVTNAYISVDIEAGTYSVVPITSWTVVGSVVPNGWSVTGGLALTYQGNGVWKDTLNMSRVSTLSDPERFIFVMNQSWSYSMSRISGTAESVALSGQGYTVEDIRVNHGTYIITLDLQNYKYYIENDGTIDEEKISIFGSSVSNGQGATDNHGYAYLYGQLQSQRLTDNKTTHDWEISSIAINGNNTINLLDRYNDLIHEFGRYVIFGLSLGNEGIHNAADYDSVYNQFNNNMTTLIAKAKADGKIPVVMNNYTRGDFDANDYYYVKQMNLLIHGWDVASVNMLGAIDNGAGVWADGYQVVGDVYHPTDAGHTEFLYAMVPSLFDAIAAGKAQPTITDTDKSITLAQKSNISFIPEETTHSFTISVKVKGNALGTILAFNHSSAIGTISVNSDGKLVYTSPITGTIVSENVLSSDWNLITLTHYYAQGFTKLYVGSTLQGSLSEQLIPVKFVLGDEATDVTREFAQLFFYRSGMNMEEITAINSGSMLKSSLEIYSPLEYSSNTIANLAQSTNTLSVNINSISTASGSLLSDNQLSIVGRDGAIEVNSVAQKFVSIYGVDGRLIFRDSVCGQLIINNVEPGIYLSDGIKIIVK